MSSNLYFTDRSLKALAPARKGKRYELWDTKIPGFGVRVNDETDRARKGKAGRISFVLYTRFPGSPHPSRRALGRYGQLTLEAARDKAAQWRAMVDKGIDPAIGRGRAPRPPTADGQYIRGGGREVHRIHQRQQGTESQRRRARVTAIYQGVGSSSHCQHQTVRRGAHYRGHREAR